jgi:hypothetical protein
MATEQWLDRATVGQCTASIGDSRRGELLDIVMAGAESVRLGMPMIRGSQRHRRTSELVRRPWHG